MNRKILVRRRSLYNLRIIFVFAWNEWKKMDRNFRVFGGHARNRVGYLQNTSIGRYQHKPLRFSRLSLGHTHLYLPARWNSVNRTIFILYVCTYAGRLQFEQCIVLGSVSKNVGPTTSVCCAVGYIHVNS
jgi:hypothetical protein